VPLAPASSTPAQGAAGLSRRILLLTPADGDAAAIARVLGTGGFEAVACSDLIEVATEFSRDGARGAGAVIMAQEGLFSAAPGEQRVLTSALRAQPEWSDLPLILLAGSPGQGDRAWEFAQSFEPVGNITILERPLRRATLLNAVTVALRTRDRQYDLRETLGELARHRQHLEVMVSEKAAELAASNASLHASERLASLGTLAAGLGHDLANLTLPIRARLEALRSGIESNEALADLDAIGEALAHLSRLSAGMRLMALDPSRETASTPADDLTAWAEETIPMLRASIPMHVRLESAIAPGLGVAIPRHRLAQAVFNLVQNAGEAMGAASGGTVRLVAEGGGDCGDAGVRIEISDNGPGMPPEVRARCFEPYFSTKTRAISTGMGLGMVKGIIEGAGGTITVDSAEGVGTTFRLMLPGARPSAGTRGAGARLTGAISVSQPRAARLARLLLNELGIVSVHHDASTPPSASLWIVDGAGPDCVGEYLGCGGDRRAIVLTPAEPAGGAAFDTIQSRYGDRLARLPAMPSAGMLRKAILSAVGDAVGAAG
jgi:signal transduction histidine kinase